jgi:hypothetical protein
MSVININHFYLKTTESDDENNWKLSASAIGS